MSSPLLVKACLNGARAAGALDRELGREPAR